MRAPGRVHQQQGARGETMPGQIELFVNGRIHLVPAALDTPLLYVLRNDLGLKGPKPGCGKGQCGACKVLVGGRAIASCQLTAGSAVGKPITTIEGLADADELHPVQKAFVDENAAQCGYCTSGMIITAVALLGRNPRPTDDEIRDALETTLCRCGSHERIRRAIRRAAGDPEPLPAYQVRRAVPVSAAVGPLPRPLETTPEVDRWIRFEVDDTVTVFSGKTELGQDLRTSIAMIAAEELDVPLARVRVVLADTGRSPDEGYTASSMSLETSGNAVRHAAAHARALAIAAASVALGVPAERLAVAAGAIADAATGRSVSYGLLFGGKLMEAAVTGTAAAKPAERYAVVGRAAGRLDMRAKVTGAPHFVQDLAPAGLVYGRAVRPPGYGATLAAVDAAAAERMPGVLAVVRDGSFLAVVAAREEQAIAAAEALAAAATWRAGPGLPSSRGLFERMIAEPAHSALVVAGVPTDGPVPPVASPPDAALTVTATYERPYHMHASIGPSAAVAQLADGRLTVWCHSQGPYPVRAGIAQVLGMAEADVRLVHVDGSGCYGHNGADDAALDAALLARAVPGKPVAVQWSRADENAWEPYGPAMVVKMQASLDARGSVVEWSHDLWGYSHVSRPRAGTEVSGLLAAWHLGRPFKLPIARPDTGLQGGLYRNSEPLYDFPRKRVVSHFLADSPLRVSALRGLGSYANIFAVESFVDEIARAAGVDPVSFRLAHLVDERARAVIEAAVERAGAKPAGRGRGMAFAQYKNRQSYVAVVVDLVVDRTSGAIDLERACVAVDSGQIVNPDGLANQAAGAFLQSASWTLYEEVGFDETGITSLDWRSYPILRRAPRVETVLLDSPGMPWLGIGEGAQGPAAAAIANAVHDAVGVRLRRIPFTPQRVLAALARAGAKE
jgi:nicotinate dehydrogenase subunit B